MLSAQAVLRQACGCWTVQVRSKSTKYLQNRPRSFKRRLYEAAVAPVLHERPQTPAEKCIMRPVYQDRLKADIDEMPPIEQALGRLVKNMMRSYRVMAVCQMNPVDGRTFWLARNQMRLQGLETKYYGNRVMKWVFEGTPLQTLEPLLVSSNCYMFAKELDSIKQIVSCAQKYNWMTPIAVVMDDRIFSMAEIQKLAQLSSLSMLPAQTVAVLASIPRQATQALDHHARNLVASLGHIANMKKDES